MSAVETIDQYWQAYRRHDLDGVLAHLADDVVVEFPTSEEPSRGKDSIRAVWAKLFSTIIPDINPEVITTVAQGDTVACEFVETGTLVIPAEAAAAGVEPGGRPYTMSMVTFFHLNGDGLIDRLRSYWDTGNFARQLGIDIGVISVMQAKAHATA